MKILKIIVLGLILSNASAFATEFGVLGGLSTFSPTVGGYTLAPLTSKSGSGLAAGAFVRGNLAAMFSLELEAIYVKKKFQLANSALGLDSTFDTKSIQIPLILRMSLVPGGLINVGVGAYYEIGMSGGLDATDNPTGATGNTSYAGLNLKHNDIGALGTIELKLPLAPLAHFIVDGRYVYGLTEQALDTSGGFSFKNRYIQILGGLSFGM